MVAGPGPAVTLIEEGDNQDDEADILVVTETMPASARLVGSEGQGALVRNILEAEKALQACSCCSLSILTIQAPDDTCCSNFLTQECSEPETNIGCLAGCRA